MIQATWMWQDVAGRAQHKLFGGEEQDAHERGRSRQSRRSRKKTSRSTRDIRFRSMLGQRAHASWRLFAPHLCDLATLNDFTRHSILMRWLSQGCRDRLPRGDQKELRAHFRTAPDTCLVSGSAFCKQHAAGLTPIHEAVEISTGGQASSAAAFDSRHCASPPCTEDV